MSSPTNSDTGKVFIDVMRQRLCETSLTFSQRSLASSILKDLLKYQKIDSLEIAVTQAEFVKKEGLNRQDVSRLMITLEQIGAIRRIKRGVSNILFIESMN